MLTSFALSGCASEKDGNEPEAEFPDNISVREIKPFRFIESVRDSLYLSSVEDIAYVPNRGFFISLIKERMLVHLDENLNFIKTIGRSGEGPGELSFPSELVYNADSLYVKNSRSIEVFTLDGEYIRTIHIPINIFGFGTDGHFLYISTHAGENPLFKFDLNGRKISSFGEQHKPSKTNYFRRLNYRYVAVDNRKEIIAALTTEPVFEKYSDTGRLIQKIDIREIPIIKDRYVITRSKNEEHEKKNEFRMVNILYDGYACFRDGKLYLPLSLSGPTSYILILDAGGSTMRPLEILQATGMNDYDKVALHSIGVSDDGKMLAYDSVSGGILVYDLNQEPV